MYVCKQAVIKITPSLLRQEELVSGLVFRYDISEPHYGKDVCNRILCLMKTCIRRFCNEGHDILGNQ